jgi:hypothetical protein
MACAVDGLWRDRAFSYRARLRGPHPTFADAKATFSRAAGEGSRGADFPFGPAAPLLHFVAQGQEELL